MDRPTMIDVLADDIIDRFLNSTTDDVGGAEFVLGDVDAAEQLVSLGHEEKVALFHDVLARVTAQLKNE